MNEHLVRANSFMTLYSVPGDLQGRVRAYLKQLFENQSREDMKKMLMGWIKMGWDWDICLCLLPKLSYEGLPAMPAPRGQICAQTRLCRDLFCALGALMRLSIPAFHALEQKRHA